MKCLVLFFCLGAVLFSWICLQLWREWSKIYIKVEESGGEWYKVERKFQFCVKPPNLEVGVVLCSWESTITQWTRKAD